MVMVICLLFSILGYMIQDKGMVYKVHKISLFESSAWSKANRLTDFVFPWEQAEAPATQFQALYDDTHFYFRFEAEDHDIYAPGDPHDKRGVLPSDRVEIFFKAKGQMDPYYCLEMDPRGRVLDYIAKYYRHTDFEWEWPEEHLTVKAYIQAESYIVEGKISLQSLRDMDILDDERQMDAGLFRGDAYHVNENTTDIKWISWIRPESAHPDFHIPSAFGKLILVP